MCAKSRVGTDPLLEWCFLRLNPSLRIVVSKTHLDHETRSPEAKKKKSESHRKTECSRSMGCEVRGLLECIACLFHVSSRPEEIFRHLLLPHNHARVAVLVT